MIGSPRCRLASTCHSTAKDAGFAIAAIVIPLLVAWGVILFTNELQLHRVVISRGPSVSSLARAVTVARLSSRQTSRAVSRAFSQPLLSRAVTRGATGPDESSGVADIGSSEDSDVSNGPVSLASFLKVTILMLPLKDLLFFYQISPTLLGETAPWSTSGFDNLLLSVIGFTTVESSASAGASGSPDGTPGFCLLSSLSAVAKVACGYLFPFVVLVGAVLWQLAAGSAQWMQQRRLRLHSPETALNAGRVSLKLVGMVKPPPAAVRAQLLSVIHWNISLTTFRLVHCVTISGQRYLFEAAEDVACWTPWQVPLVMASVVLWMYPATRLGLVCRAMWRRIHQSSTNFHAEVVNSAGDLSGASVQPVEFEAWRTPANSCIRLSIAAVGVFLQAVPVARALGITMLSLLYLSINMTLPRFGLWKSGDAVPSADTDSGTLLSSSSVFRTFTLMLQVLLCCLNIPTATLLQAPGIIVSDVNTNTTPSGADVEFRRSVATLILFVPIAVVICQVLWLFVMGCRDRCRWAAVSRNSVL